MIHFCTFTEENALMNAEQCLLDFTVAVTLLVLFSVLQQFTEPRLHFWSLVAHSWLHRPQNATVF